VPRILRKPSVVVDLAAGEFWTTLLSGEKANEGIAKISDKELIPINGELLSRITEIHSIWHAILYEDGGVPMIPTYVNLSPIGGGEVERLTGLGYEPPVLPNIYVHKQSFDSHGVRTSHRGSGVTILKTGFLSGARKYYPQDAYEFLQPFVVPQADEKGERYVRDVRVFVIGNQPAVGLVRKAREPLSQKNLRGEEAPRISQVYTAIDRGPKEVLSEPLKSKVFEQAEKVINILERKVRSMNGVYSDLAPVGYMSLDFLIDTNGVPLPVDCDVQPWVDPFQDTNLKVAEKLAKYASFLATLTKNEKRVVIVGPEDDFSKLVYQKTKALIGKKETEFEESLLSKAVKNLQRRGFNK
jgi:hypothetical protein